MHFNRILLPLLCAGLAGLPLAAQDLRLGVQGALSFPGGDLSDAAQPGLQVGGHLRWDFRQGHGLIARVDWTAYGDKNDVSTSSAGLGADYTYHFERTQRGFYVLAGLSMQTYRRDYPDGYVNDSGLGLDLGVGYDLDRHLGLQARLTSQSVNHATLTALNLGASFTF
jgi:hypothetical protein